MNNISLNPGSPFLFTKEAFSFIEADWLWKAKEFEAQLKSIFPPVILPLTPDHIEKSEDVETQPTPNP